jgi:hypothetical protein
MSDDAKKPEQEPVFDSVDPVRRRLMMGAAALGGASATGMLGALAPRTAAARDVLQGYNTPIPHQIMTPDTVDTRIGTLRFMDGRPTSETVRLVYDNLDFMRGVEVFLNFIPACSIEGIRRGLVSQGADASNKLIAFDRLMDSNPLFLTGNTDSVYGTGILDLQRDGATVVEIPAGMGPSTVNDAFFRFVVDMGAPGPDRGKGGKYLILPPDYEGDLAPPVGGYEAEVDGVTYYVARSTSYVNWFIARGFLVDGKTDAAMQAFRDGLKIYPLAQKDNPPALDIRSGSEQVFNTIHANDFEFYEELDTVIQREPISMLDPELRGLAAAIGIHKGRPFAPDDRMKAILVDAVAVGNATAWALWCAPKDESIYIYENSGWYTAFVGGSYEWLRDEGKGGRYLDARSIFFYIATVNTPAMVLKMVGVGSQYALNNVDSTGAYLDGAKSYKLNIPANVPAKDFWSVVAYDPQTRSQLQTSQPFPSRNNKRDSFAENADGSVDIFFGPTAPEGKEDNWIETIPGKGWFTILRLYGPLDPWFDKTWRPGEIEAIS